MKRDWGHLNQSWRDCLLSGIFQAQRGLQSFDEYSENWKFKMLIIFAYDFRGVLTTHKVPAGKTVNAEYYKEYIQKYLRPVIRKKPPELLAEGLILLQSAMPHKTGGVTSLKHERNSL